MLLKLNTLGDDVADHSFFLEAAKFFKALKLSLLALFFKEGLASVADSVHELWLQEVIEGI